jgi:hypothetical protein
VIGQEPAAGARCGRLLSQDAAHGVVAEPVAEARPADGRDLAEVQRRVLALPVNDRLAQLLGDALMAFALGRGSSPRRPSASKRATVR